MDVMMPEDWGNLPYLSQQPKVPQSSGALHLGNCLRLSGCVDNCFTFPTAFALS